MGGAGTSPLTQRELSPVIFQQPECHSVATQIPLFGLSFGGNPERVGWGRQPVPEQPLGRGLSRSSHVEMVGNRVIEIKEHVLQSRGSPMETSAG